MHQVDNETSTDLFLTKACKEVWSQRIAALAPELGAIPELSSTSVFCYAMSSGRVVFGMPVQELADSYLVAMPAVLVDNEGVIQGTSMVSEPLVRLFKSGLLFVSACAEKHLPVYYAYIYEKRRLLQGLLPEVLLKDVEESSREHAARVAFSKSFPEDRDDDSGTVEGESAARSTMSPYYRKLTRH